MNIFWEKFHQECLVPPTAIVSSYITSSFHLSSLSQKQFSWEIFFGKAYIDVCICGVSSALILQVSMLVL